MQYLVLRTRYRPTSALYTEFVGVPLFYHKEWPAKVRMLEGMMV